METVIDWSKAPEGTEAAHPGSEQVHPAWFKRDVAGLVEQICPGAGINNWSWMGGRRDFPYGHVLRPQPWTGEGLPPVGTVCESMWNESRDEWLKAKVFGVNEHGQPIFRWEEGVEKYEYQASPLLGNRGKPYFRPIRTPEQIKAQEREAEIETLRVLLSKVACDDYNAAVAVFEAGYRKQVAP